MDTGEISFRRLSAEEGRGFDDAYQIYHASISAAERKSREALLEMLASEHYRFVVARDGGRVVGMAVVFAADGVALLEYLAVEEGRRGGGVGSGLFRYCAGLSGEPMLVEVESADQAGAGQVIRQRRVGFYRRLGCQEFVGLDYLLPLPGEHPRMRLMVCGAVSDSLPLATVRRYLVTLYVRVYGQSASDPRIGAMVAGLGDPVLLA